MAFQSHLFLTESNCGLAAVANAFQSYRDGRSKNMPLMALLPPTTLPARTKAVLFFASGTGRDWTTK
jgi:hypothetical protein